jgi:dTDP-4-dehydrorhamnose 3,5-epimerase
VLTKSDIGIEGAFKLNFDRFTDHRGDLIKLFSSTNFAQNGLVSKWNESILVDNPHKHTVRGLHFQSSPASQAKVIICLTGEIKDVVLDIRTNSPSFGAVAHIPLSSSKMGLYLPPGVAHGYITLKENTNLLYLLSEEQNESLDNGYNIFDPKVNLGVNVSDALVSERDLKLPIFWRS